MQETAENDNRTEGKMKDRDTELLTPTTTAEGERGKTSSYVVMQV